jgi:hypothetical protein
MAELTIRIPQLTPRRLIIGGAGLGASLFLAAVAILFLNRTSGLATIAHGQIEAFTPLYFAHETPPDGYKLDREHSRYDGNLLQMTIAKPGGAPVVITEQARPAKLDPDQLLTNTSAVKGTAGAAGVTIVEGRVVGTMLPAGMQTLVLVNAPGSVDESDVSDILKSLRPR